MTHGDRTGRAAEAPPPRHTRASSDPIRAVRVPPPTLTVPEEEQPPILRHKDARKSQTNINSVNAGFPPNDSLTVPPLSAKTISTRPPSFLRRPMSPGSASDVIMEERHSDGDQASAKTDLSTGPDDAEKPTTPNSARDKRLSAETNVSQQSSRPGRPPTDLEPNRLSFSSLFSMGSAFYNGAMSVPNPASGASSVAGSVKSGQAEPYYMPSAIPISPSTGSVKMDATSAPTTATDIASATAQAPREPQPRQGTTNGSSRPIEPRDSGSLPRLQNPAPDRRSRSRTQRRPSGSAAGSSMSPGNKDRRSQRSSTPKFKIGVCALDTKARSKPSRNILTRLQNNGEFEILVFGDKVILDEAVENWPLCDFLISFFSDGFPLDKAIAYAQLRKPFCVNDLPMQKVLWDRRLCLRILDKLGVRTPKRLEVNRDGGPTLESPSLADHVYRMSGVRLEGPDSGIGGTLPPPKDIKLSEDTNTLIMDGVSLTKPFVEKPVSGEDHNIRIYFPWTKDGEGGGRKLFRKIGNKSSEWDHELTTPRAITESDASYIYEQFLDVHNAEDVKAYTVGSNFCHAETRKSPVVDGLVRRNTHGKEIRYITALSTEEASMASRIADGFGQRICGFDLLRAGGKSYVIDVNGWSFVKDNNEYYDKCAGILRQIFYEHLQRKQRREMAKTTPQLSQDPSQDSENDHTAPRQPGSHRATLKGLLKSPSLHKLRAHGAGKVHSGTASPADASGATTPLTSPRTSERDLLEPRIVVPTSVSDSHLHPVRTGTGSIVAMPDDPTDAPMPASKHSWKLKGMVSVIRHADRTPKQKFKFTFHTQPFVDLLKGHQEEVLLKGEAALSSVMNAVKQAMKEGVEDPEKLNLLRTSLARKGAWTGTKVQIKPMFKKRKIDSPVKEAAMPTMDEPAVLSQPQTPVDNLSRQRSIRSDSLTGVTLSRFSAAENDLVFDKLQLIIKWGGEPTHSARYQTHDLGENMRNDLLLMNREALGDVRVFTSSERRVSTSAQIWAASFLDKKDVPESFISVRKDLLDDSNAAKDIMDKVKKKLKTLLREGHEAPPQFAWPSNTPQPAVVVRRVVELMKFHRRVMRYNFNKLHAGSSGSGTASSSLSALNIPNGEPTSSNSNSNSTGSISTMGSSGRQLAQAHALVGIQARWCCGEDAELFKERWEKLFAEFTDHEKVDPSKISELYDTMKFDALHNRQFLEWVFTPTQGFLDEYLEGGNVLPGTTTTNERTTERHRERAETTPQPRVSAESLSRKNSTLHSATSDRSIAHRMNLRRKSVSSASSPLANEAEEDTTSYFKLFPAGGGQSRAKQDARLESLRELYRYAKILFDFICPQEYGISDSEKLEIGLLTSLPLLREITSDLEEVQASEDAKTFIYFTKESHIYTLLNAILEGGVKTKIARNAIPELDYLSQICFELYEAEDKEADTFAYSIRISLSPGCHTSDPLDLQLDSKHSIGCAPRRSLTAHQNWKEVIGTLRDKFHTVKLPKSFLTINLSEKHAREASKNGRSDEDASDEPETERDPVNMLGQEREVLAEVADSAGKEASVADLEAESEIVRRVQGTEVDESNY
jgi:inositol-hexakisphosphate/diphosphoinositol-pentakisphosphate 1-kinase